MKWCLILGLFFSLTLQAQQQCESLFVRPDHLANWRDESNSVFKKSLHGDSTKGDKELTFYWHTSHPPILKRAEGSDSKYIFSYSHKRNVIAYNHPDPDSKSPLEYLGTIGYKRDLHNEEFVEEFVKTYKEKAPDDVIKEIETVEEDIINEANVRQSFGYVATAPVYRDGVIIGTFRVFNGSAGFSRTPPYLPSERSFRYRGIRTGTARYLKKLRKKNPRLPIFEVGKFFLLGTPEMKERAKALIELYWLKNFIDTVPPDSVFIAHVDSLAHVRHYQRRYGFRILERIITPDEKKVSGDREVHEYTLIATAAELQASFRKLYPVAPTGVEITLP